MKEKKASLMSRRMSVLSFLILDTQTHIPIQGENAKSLWEIRLATNQLSRRELTCCNFHAVMHFSFLLVNIKYLLLQTSSSEATGRPHSKTSKPHLSIKISKTIIESRKPQLQLSSSLLPSLPSFNITAMAGMKETSSGKSVQL